MIYYVIYCMIPFISLLSLFIRDINDLHDIHVDLRFEMSMCEAYVEMVLEEDQTELQALEEEQSDEEDTIVAYNNNDLINLPSYILLSQRQ